MHLFRAGNGDIPMHQSGVPTEMGCEKYLSAVVPGAKKLVLKNWF
jgi:hypothetical protein